MKLFARLFILLTATAFVLGGCMKAKDLSYFTNGNAPTLSASASTLTPARADSNNVILTLNWTNPNYSTDSSTVKYILEIDSAGKNFTNKVTRQVSGKRTFAFTGRELNSILLGYGYALGTPVGLDMRVVSSYANNNERYVSNTVKVVVTPFGDPSKLVSQNTSVTGTLANAALPSNTFTWSPAFVGYTGAVTYTLQYDSAGKGFVSPIDFPIGASQYSRNLTQAEMNTTGLNSGIPMGNAGTVEYRIKAQTAQGAVSYSNVVNVGIQTYVPIIRLYMPGSYQVRAGYGSNDWEPTTAPEMIRDMRSSVFNQMYYAYMYFNAGEEFKITQGRSWNTNWGPSAAVSGTGTGTTTLNSNNNFKITTSGVYRVTININTNQFNIMPGMMGFVGDAIAGNNWTPSNSFPAAQMAFVKDNLFIGIQDFVPGGWKMIDNPVWNSGSNAVDEPRSYGAAGGSGTTLEVNSGTNMPNISTAGRYRVIWDGRDPNNVIYNMYPATEMRLVGDGIQGVNPWDPTNSPQMTYLGSGKWRITTTLVANKDIKFLAGNAWGAFDYEDASGGSQAVGTPRKIIWDGNQNFKTPTTTGTYTITLDELNQTVTIQ